MLLLTFVKLSSDKTEVTLIRWVKQKRISVLCSSKVACVTPPEAQTQVFQALGQGPGMQCHQAAGHVLSLAQPGPSCEQGSNYILTLGGDCGVAVRRSCCCRHCLGCLEGHRAGQRLTSPWGGPHLLRGGSAPPSSSIFQTVPMRGTMCPRGTNGSQEPLMEELYKSSHFP